MPEEIIPTEPPALPRDALELLAARLYTLDSMAIEVESERDQYLTEDISVWRSDAAVRAKWLAQAKLFLKILKEDSGLRVAVSNSKKVTAALDDVMTIPAQRAYDLPDD